MNEYMFFGWDVKIKMATGSKCYLNYIFDKILLIIKNLDINNYKIPINNRNN